MLKKNRLEKVRKHDFYKHTNIVTKKWGEKNARNNFPESYEYREKKRWKKIVLKKCENTFFYKHTNIVTKKLKKIAKIFFPETHEYLVEKMMEKNRLEKVRKHVFL